MRWAKHVVRIGRGIFTKQTEPENLMKIYLISLCWYVVMREEERDIGYLGINERVILKFETIMCD